MHVPQSVIRIAIFLSQTQSNLYGNCTFWEKSWIFHGRDFLQCSDIALQTAQGEAMSDAEYGELSQDVPQNG